MFDWLYTKTYEKTPAIDEEIDRGTHSQEQMVEAHLKTMFGWNQNTLRTNSACLKLISKRIVTKNNPKSAHFVPPFLRFSLDVNCFLKLKRKTNSDWETGVDLKQTKCNISV